MIMIASIQDAVAHHYDLAVSDLTGPSRKRCHAHPRQIAMTLAFRLTDHSKARISAFFGKHPNASFWAVAAVARRQSVNERTRQDLRRITLELARR